MNKLISLFSILFSIIQIVLSFIIIIENKTIPTHWNLLGEVDEYGSSINILIITIINILSFISLTFLSNHPEICNFPSPYKNKKIAFKKMSNLITLIKLFISVIFFYITLSCLFNIFNVYFLIIIFVCLVVETIIGVVGLVKS